MKKTILSVFALTIFVLLNAQVHYQIHENSYQKIAISFIFNNLQSIDVDTEEGKFSRIFMEGCGGSHSVGNPELPVSVNMLEIPIFGDYVLNVYAKEFEIFDAKELEINNPVYPAQPSKSKTHQNPVEFFYNKNTYQIDAFYALPLAQFKEVGMMRNINLGELYVSPVQYNPVTQEIKLYKAIDVEILFKKTELVKTQAIKDLHQSPLFHSSHIINPMNNSRAEFSNAPIKYLIVAHAMFRDQLNTFIAWKKRKGFLVEIGYTDDENVGTGAASIANFITSHYTDATPDNPAPTFVLLVGDIQQIPAFTGLKGHTTDLYYFTWAGGNLPCCYYGRFSAQNLNQLIPQIEKTLQYEQYTMPDPNYLNNISLIAGYDSNEAPIYGNGFVNYATQHYANQEYGYSTIYAHFHPCNTINEAEQIRSEIGAGVGIANFTAHCSPSGWSSPSFSVNHVSNMNNMNKYGLMIGNCCESNKFDSNECFGEALLRASGKGAVGYIGATDDTYWDEDYYWSIGFRNNCTANPQYDPTHLGAYDRLFHLHDENYNHWSTTFGAMIFAGNSAIQAFTLDDYMKKYYWEIYHLMGDPSIMTYLTKPVPMPVEINNVIPFGDSTLSAKVAPYAYCALTDSAGELVYAGFADANGDITLKFAPKEAYNYYEFAAWAQNHIQYFKTVYFGYVGLNENDKTSACTVYPNPTNGELRITNHEFGITDVEIFDIYGKQLSSHHFIPQASHHLINISHFQAGIYFLKIITEKGIEVQKIIKI
ncbi:MAG: C25 family cysteine peptidase [Lentimicrobiaceae bacterium]|nr:C25 family cysteine peptidase [Lentimicrobiaceae bacterium]